MALVVFKSKWFAPNNQLFERGNPPQNVSDKLVPFLPKDAKIVTVEQAKEAVEKAPAATLRDFDAVRAEADAQDRANALAAANIEEIRRANAAKIKHDLATKK
jgi:hypothetical protein